jgi:hypothetical protein
MPAGLGIEIVNRKIFKGHEKSEFSSDKNGKAAKQLISFCNEEGWKP